MKHFSHTNGTVKSRYAMACRKLLNRYLGADIKI